MPTPRLAVSAVGYFPPGAETYPRGEIDTIVWIVFVACKQGWKVSSIWLTREAANKASGKFKHRQTKIVSVYVPGLLLTAVTKLRTAE